MTETDYLYTRAEAPDLHVLNFKATRLWFAALALVFVNYDLLTNVLGWTFYWQHAGDGAATTVVTALSISVGAIAFFLRQNSLQVQLGFFLTFLALGLAISTRALELFLCKCRLGFARQNGLEYPRCYRPSQPLRPPEAALL